MAFKPENLSALAYADGFTLWRYKSKDIWHDIAKLGYFNEASRQMREGDHIKFSAADGWSGELVVTASDEVGVAVRKGWVA